MRLILALVAAVLVASPLDAQSALPRIDDNVVVTAAVEEEEVDSLPASVTVIDGEEIAARQATEVGDLLSTVAGLHVARSGSPGQVSSLFTRGTESDHTLVLWNGIELNDPYFGGFNWAFLPAEGVERVEVVRGPFSALYGSDALGGVVQIVSDMPQGASLRLEGGEHGYGRGALIAGHARGRVSFSLVGHVQRGDGEFDNAFYDSEEVVGRASWQLRPKTTLGVTVRANDSESGIPFSGGLPSPRRTIAWSETEVAVPLRAELETWTVDARLSSVAYDSAFRDPDDAFGFTESDTESAALRARLVASRELGDGLSIAFGSEVERLEVDDRSVFGVNLDGAEQETWALFGQLLWQIGPARVDLGLRRDDNDVYGEEVSPKLGVSFDLGERSRLWAAFGQGFRAPSVGELFFPFSGNRELAPETSDNFELGFERRLTAGSLGLVLFENRIEDLIDFDLVTFTNVNLGRARTRGVEGRPGWTGRVGALRANLTWLEVTDRDTGLDLLRRPQWTGSVVTTVRPGDWVVNLTGIFVGERPDVDPVTFQRAENGSYTRLDLALEWSARERLRPYLRVENLVDESYQEALGFPAPGRTVILGLAL